MRPTLFFAFIIVSAFVNCQVLVNLKKPAVGTVEFFRKGFPLSFPAIELFGNNSLELRLDIFGNQRNTLYYTIELCDYDWKPVDIDPSDYIEGYTDNVLEAFSGSINTTIEYVHYRLILPNEYISFRRAGNYVIKLFSDSDLQDTLLFRRFIVYEDIVSTTIVQDKYQSQILETSQELTVTLSASNETFAVSTGELKLCVLQNNNWATAQYFEKYTTNSKGELAYNLPGEIVFNGRNEYRFFDMKSLKFISERVKYIAYEAPFYHVYLKPDNIRGNKDYFFREDLNGLFYIDNTDTDVEETTDADYAYVHFTLESAYPFPDDIYISGAISDWSFGENYLTYNIETGSYECKLLLKQGLYNYCYEMVEYDTKNHYTDITEGDFYQTSNNYLAIIYYKPIGDLYFQPFGIGVLTTK